jgi:hypothetical protein
MQSTQPIPFHPVNAGKKTEKQKQPTQNWFFQLKPKSNSPTEQTSKAQRSQLSFLPSLFFVQELSSHFQRNPIAYQNQIIPTFPFNEP